MPHLIFKLRNNLNSTISHADLLAEAKEDINSEVQSYKEEQINSMKQDLIPKNCNVQERSIKLGSR